MRLSLLASTLFAVFGLAPAQITPAKADPPVKIGVLTDMSGVSSDGTGRGSVEAARMAVEDFGGSVLGAPIQVVFADHLHKADVGSAIARRWLDAEGVDVIVDIPDSAVALAVQQIVRERNKIALYSSAGTTALVQAQCSPNGIQWTYDTYALAHGTAGAVVRNGATKWFIVGADYAFGRQLAADITSVVQANGGTVLGSVWHPLNNPDFSSYLLTAQASGAQVIAIASAGGDATNAIKQAAEFHLGDGGQQLAAMIFLPQDAHSLGLKATQGIYLTTSFYSDIDDATRAWSKRFTERVGAGPSMLQAGVYSSVAHYLKAVKAAGTKDTAKVMAQMRAMPVEDFMTHGGHIRADGHLMRDMYLAQVKTPAESKGEWDLFKIITRIPAEDVVWPLSESKCPLVTH
ncbi:MAG: ABC transporter substrate-binding protein [Rhodospirillales bacterium]|nr:ABC transporter substrate-binding protein [Rhodospirillales bacterium]